MWKRVSIGILTLIAALSVYITYSKQQMEASPANTHPYYQVGDVFERNMQASFLMGGRVWQLFYTDQGVGYISDHDMGTSAYIEEIDNIIAVSKTNFANGNSDAMGEFVKNLMQGQLRPMTIAEYAMFTKGESDLSLLDSHFGPYFWLDDKGPTINERVLYWRVPSGDNFLIQGYNHIMEGYQRNGQHHAARYVPIIKINLPQKGILKSIQADQTNVSKSYPDNGNQAGQTIVNINTTEGEGPYHFYVYDTDIGGNGTYTNPSSYFTLDSDSANGTAKVNIINQLPVGDYYFKVKVMDESTNDRLYYEPSDFTKDPYRTKETGVIHVQITKVSPTIVFDAPNQTKKSVQDAGTSTNWNETATANPFNPDLQIKYTIVSGDVGLIDLNENSGAVTYKGNGAFGKVKIRATVDDDPATGMDNYNSAYVEKEIVVYREVDGVVTPHVNSSDANAPTFQANDANVKTGGTIGTIKGTMGTPDTIGGTTTTYSYAIKSGGNGSFFTVN
ncbi:MAG: hypothetical protein HFE67_05580, partial [Erysipelotrichaceae bacterium]|nr:hypothetical protein [Erysipelotrichaceae bacterium]